MKKLFSLFTIVFALLATFIRVDNVNVVANEAIVLSTVGDAYVAPGGYANTNYGTNANLLLRYRTDSTNQNNNEIYTKFEIPSGIKAVSSAILSLTVSTLPTNQNVVGRTINVYVSSSDWDESTITYNNAPSHVFDTYATFTPTVEPAKGDTIEIDVKDLINAYLSSNGVVVDGQNTNLTLHLKRDGTANELALQFQAKEHSAKSVPTLSIVATSADAGEEGIIKDQFASLETYAQLNFGMEYSSVASQVEERLLACATTTTTMNKNNNFAEQFGVDPEIFNVNAILNGANSFPSINKAGYVRLYADTNDGIGNALQVKLQDETKVITSVSFKADNGANLVLLDALGNNIALTNDGDVYSATLNSNMFAIQNNNSEKIIPNIYEIDVTYDGYAIKYIAFKNVDMRFVAEIPTALLEYVESFGFDLTVNGKTKNVPVTKMSDENDGKSFAVVIRDIKVYDVDITAVAYVIVNGEKIALQSKTYSVLSIVDKYIKDAETLNLTSTQIAALNAFKALNA